MFGFAAVAETPLSAELTKYTIGIVPASVSAASALNAPQFSGGVNLPALTGVSATLANTALDIDGKANITTANVASTTSIAALTISGKANVTHPSLLGTFTPNVPSITGVANTNLPSQGALDSTVEGEVAQATNITVTVANSGSGNKFYFDGVEAPTITLVRGLTYTFDISHSSLSGHPLAFKSGNNSYTTGVTSNGNPGTSGANVVFAVPSDAPGIGLRYYCTVHGNGMGNTITTSAFAVSLVAQGKATHTSASVAAVIDKVVPSITGLAFFTLPDVNATIAQNLDDPTGVLFPFDDFAENFSRGRTVTIIAPTIGNRTVYIAAENRTVVIRPVRRDNVVYITN
jgi:hypothetical protein